MGKLPYSDMPDQYGVRSFEPLPPGKYQAIVTASEIVPTKSGNGTRINLTWQIIEGYGAGRLVFSGHTVVNPNADAEKIGRAQLREFATAMGIELFEETDQLHGKPCIIRIGIEEDKTGQYEPKNNVKGAVAIRPMNAVQAGRNTARTETQSLQRSLQRSNGSSNSIPPAHVASQTLKATGASPRGRAAMNTTDNPFDE